MKNTLKSALAILIISVTITSCATNNVPVLPTVYDTGELLTRNYLTSAAGFDWLIDGNKISTDLQYAFGSKGPFQWDTNLTEVLLSINDTDTGNELFSINLPVENNNSYYSALVGPISSGTVVFSQNDLTTPAAGNIRLRFLHAYQDVGMIDIYIGGITADHKKVTSLDFAQLTAYIEVAVDDANAMIICTNTGVAPDELTNLLTIGANTSHTSGKIYEEALASLNIDPASKFSLFVTEQ